MVRIPSTYPGGSKGRVTRAGAAVRENRDSDDDIAVIDAWRAAHRPVLNTFNVMLRRRAKNFPGAKVGVRHKRRRTIFNKLSRYPDMQLARMDDIAGCRVIFDTIEDLHNFRRELHAARFDHKRRNDVDKYDYIKTPKSTGYRGIHDIYEYDARPGRVGQASSSSKGLYVEIQYRTFVQHAWATAVEVIGNITQSQPKFQQGDSRYERAMLLASEILARTQESSNSYLPDLADADLIEEFTDLDQELGLLRTLRNLNAVEKDISSKRNVILIFDDDDNLEIKSFRYATDAIAALFELERENPDKDIVLVRADTAEDVKTAFRNYFSDARAFVQLVTMGCENLSPHAIHAIDHVEPDQWKGIFTGNSVKK